MRPPRPLLPLESCRCLLHPYTTCPNAMRHRRLDRDTENLRFQFVKETFYTIEPALPLGECLLFESRSFQLLQQSALLMRQLDRRLNNHLAQQITNATTSHRVTPFPRRRKTLPLCVSAGTFSFTRPSSVGTSNSPPSAASGNDIGTSQCRFRPSRWKIGCGLTSICTKRSPAGPPFGPASPSPVSRIRSPTSTPAGTTDRVLRFSTRPAPAQVLHGSAIISPRPRQRERVCCSEKKP